MNKAICFLLAVTLPLSIFSKNKSGETIGDIFSNVHCRADFTKVQLSTKLTAVDAVAAHVYGTNSSFNIQLSRLALQHDIESPGGQHLTFEQQYDGISIFNSQVKVNLNKQNKITSIFDNSYNTSKWNRSSLQADLDRIDASKIRSFLLKEYGTSLKHITGRKVIAIIDQQPQTLYEANVYNSDSHQYRLMLVKPNLEVVLNRDLNSYRPKPEEPGTALVFMPCPLTSANAPCDPPYVDNNDNDSPALNNERVLVDITVTLNGNTYSLENQFVQIADFSSPDIAPVTQVGTSHFDYLRSESGFEDVNTFYHLSAYQQYVTSLGFASLAGFKITADTHALNGDDQSMFSPHSVLGPRLFFGEGCVDDAEDADVIIHEYGHALSNSGSPNSNTGQERQALDEGLGDYLAASYSKAINTFGWEKVFNWDGCEECWNGRTVATSKKYPRDLVPNLHLDGEIWSSAMMQIHDFIGRGKTDSLQLQSLFHYASNMKMKDAAYVLLDADSELFNGANFCIIYNVMTRRGFFDSTDSLLSGDPCNISDKSIIVHAGNDQTICKGDTALIGNIALLDNSYIYNWSPSLNLLEPAFVTTKAFPNLTTKYTLTATALNGAFNEDEVTVNIAECRIIIVYTNDFFSGKDDHMTIVFPEGTNDGKIEVFDLLGKKFLVEENISTNQYHLDGKLLAAGAYILRVSTQDKCKNKKIVKLW